VKKRVARGTWVCGATGTEVDGPKGASGARTEDPTVDSTWGVRAVQTGHDGGGTDGAGDAWTGDAVSDDTDAIGGACTGRGVEISTGADVEDHNNGEKPSRGDMEVVCRARALNGSA
jgi:hypothetical protein